MLSQLPRGAHTGNLTGNPNPKPSNSIKLLTRYVHQRLGNGKNTHHPRLGPWSQRHTSNRGSLRTHESSCRHHWHPATIHLLCHFKSPHPTHNHRSCTQRAMNGQREWIFFLEGWLCSHLKPGRCYSPSQPTKRTHFSALSLRPSIRPHLPTGHKRSIKVEHWLRRCLNLNAPHQHSFGTPDEALGLDWFNIPSPRGPLQQ